ncbi:hypothetical protein ACFX13_012560 [Malus domestica]
MNPLPFFRSSYLQPTIFPYLPSNWNEKESRPSASQEVAGVLAAEVTPIFDSASFVITNSDSEDNPSPLQPNSKNPIG